MKKETIASVLESEGCRMQQGAFRLPEEREASAFVRTGGEVITVGRIVGVELAADHATFENARGERFFCTYEDVIGLRLNRQAAERAAGFGR